MACTLYGPFSICNDDLCDTATLWLNELRFLSFEKFDAPKRIAKQNGLLLGELWLQSVYQIDSPFKVIITF